MDDVAGEMGNRFFGTNLLEVGSLQVVHLCRSTKSDVACDLGRKRRSHGSKHTPWRQAPSFSLWESQAASFLALCPALSPPFPHSHVLRALKLVIPLVFRGVRPQQATASSSSQSAAWLRWIVLPVVSREEERSSCLGYSLSRKASGRPTGHSGSNSNSNSREQRRRHGKM